MYTKLKDIYDNTDISIFAPAVNHLLNIGFREAIDITDEGIKKVEKNGMIPKEYLQKIIKASKDIAQACDYPCEIILFCAEHKEKFENTLHLFTK